MTLPGCSCLSACLLCWVRQAVAQRFNLSLGALELWSHRSRLKLSSVQGEINIPLSEVLEKMQMHGEWPLLGTRPGCIGLDMTYMSTLQRLRGRAPRRLGQTHGVQGPSAEARHS